MTALLEHFHEAVTTPEDVDKLKKLILQLAMQGKLVEQDPNDEPASDLLKRIEIEKKRLIKEKKIKKSIGLLHPIEEDEIPYQLPKGWQWVRLGNIIMDIVGGGTPSKNNPEFWNGSIPWASVKDLKNGMYLTNTIDTITEKGLDNSSSNLIKKNSVIICTRMGLGKIQINAMDVAINQDLKAVSLPPDVLNKYFLYFFKSMSIMGSGMTVKGIRQEILLNIYFPLPPLNEQNKIVKEIEKLYEQCDQLSSHLVNKQTTSALLNKSVFTKLQDINNSEQMSDIRFIIENKEHLCNDKDSIDLLRNAILSLAIQGKLIQQEKNDEPASLLLGRIKAERERLLKEKKIKKEKSLQPIAQDDIPYRLPKGWKWVRLGEIITFLGGYAFKSNTYVEKSLFQVIRLGNVKNDKLVLQSNPAYIPEEIALENEQYLIKNNDILVTMTGTRNKRDYFYTCLVENNQRDSEFFYLNQRVGCLRTIGEVNPKLVNLFLKSTVILDMIFETETGTANQGNIGSNSIKELLFPLPPLKEQGRIVEMYTLFSNLLNDLEETFESKNQYKNDLTESLTRTFL